MRAFRGRLPRVGARRVWNLDGRPGWEFRFTSRPVGPGAEPAEICPPVVAEPRVPVRFVSSRGVEIGADVLRVEEFHHRIRMPVTGSDRVESAPAGVEYPEDVAIALVELASDPENDAAQRRAVNQLAPVHSWFRRMAVLDVSAARISGAGLGRPLEGLFVWRAEGGPDVTYLVAPAPATRDLLTADPDLVRALVRAACPRPDDALGELESSLREAITRLGVVGHVPAADPARPQVRAIGPAARLVLRVEPERALADRSGAAGAVGREKSASERALSAELAELARKVGTASVRKPSGPAVDRALEAG